MSEVPDFYGNRPERGDILLVVTPGNGELQEMRVLNPAGPGTGVQVESLIPKLGPRARPYSYLTKSERFVIAKTWDGRSLRRAR